MNPDVETLRELNGNAAALTDPAEREKTVAIAQCYQAWLDAAQRLADRERQGAAPADVERARQEVARCQSAFDEWSL